MIRRILPASLVVLMVVVLTACAGLPTSGPVQQGRPAGHDGEASDISFIPERPQPGATPEQIVDGFLRAGSGTADNWTRAREFLAEGTAWNPNTGVTVDVLGEREVVAVDADTVNVTLSTVATVDDKGVYEPADGAPTPLTFELARGDDGEWRITRAPDGVVLDRTLFANVYSSYPLMYFTTTWDYLVPDVRWFPRANVAPRIVDALLKKPSTDFLQGAVATAFPEGVTVNPAVPVDPETRVASVSLSAEVLTVDQIARDRMLTQLEASLRSAQVSGVEMRVENAVVPATSAPTLSTAVTGPALVLTETAFGFQSGDDVAPIPGLSAAMTGVPAVSIQVSRERDAAAVRQADGTVVRVRADDDPMLVDARTGLVEPSIDTFGAIWSAPAAQPQEVIVQLPDGSVQDVAQAWPNATLLDAMAVSREGARVAALVLVGGRLAIWVSGIVRDADGVPRSLSAPTLLGYVTGSGVGLAWLDDTTVGVLVRDGSTASAVDQLVGGPATTSAAPSDAASIAGGNTLASERLRGAGGTLYLRRGANWQESAHGILVLATQQGTPR